jgi:hypothetical protein
MEPDVGRWILMGDWDLRTGVSNLAELFPGGAGPSREIETTCAQSSSIKCFVISAEFTGARTNVVVAQST